ncbi:flagellar basal body P-ring protein FlgI [Ramlibacter sp. G-1-2-2]|uniref:Flagellar P-ring protein n=1 Tax=Ramlibacter agri TaxID=2728837 RepID=A0A848H050_9BURK|nr:flagellar basal body P-ring protein FlgI [Ramlibacter agri]NML42919.1 flagellar basal body P-ring protein FlgI [Ramlibacter agri]
MRALLLLVLLAGWITAAAQGTALRVKDLGKVQGWRENVLVGTGIVTGLAGTGDSPGNRATRQALSNVLAQFNLTVAPEQVNSRNVAVVMVSAALPAFAREGDTLDVSVASSGDARSLVGGNLLLTPLRAPNGRVYALAQGPLAVGGHRYDANGNVVQKNHPTAAAIPNGATVEVGMPPPEPGVFAHVTFVLAEPDYTTASRVAEAINRQLGPGLAHARDASGIEIEVPSAQQGEPVAFLARLESVAVEPDRRPRVVINERTGTVVSGGDVRLSRVAISHGDLKITVASTNSVSQPAFIGRTGPGVRTEVVTNTELTVEEPTGVGFLASGGTVADLVQSLARMKTSTRDIISILRAVKAAGALHGELVVQ